MSKKNYPIYGLNEKAYLHCMQLREEKTALLIQIFPI